MLGHIANRYLGVLVLADAGLTALALWLADEARHRLPFGTPVAPGYFLEWPIYLAAVLIWPFFLRLLGAYDPRRMRGFGDEVRAIIPAVIIATALLPAFFFAFKFQFISRLLVGYFFLLNLLFLLNLRIVGRILLNVLTSSGVATRRLLVVGAGPVGEEVVRLVQENAWTGLRVAGFVDDDPAKVHGSVAGHPVLGTTDEIVELVESAQADEIIIALPGRAHDRILRVALALAAAPVRVRIVPDLFEIVSVRARVEDFWGIPLIGLRDPVISGFDRAVKRTFDLVLTIIALPLLLPAIAVIAVAIRLFSHGPILVRLERVGENGRLFSMWKFRTMTAGAERDRRYKQSDDPRVTPVGRWLRRWSLDELPNLFNVLRGEMSLVGPRPEQPWIVERYEPWQRQRLAVLPGITGWWQVNGRSDNPLHQNVEYDLFYIQNYSPLLDLKILWKTVWVVLRGQGAY